jgi:hypothetical protein
MVLQVVSNLAAIAATVAQILSQVNSVTSRGLAIQIDNKTHTPLVLINSAHDSGGFNDPPDNTIPADHASIFGSKGTIGTAGRVQYGGSGLDLAYHVSWDVPLIGANTGTTRVDGGVAPYYLAVNSLGALAVAVAKHELLEHQTEDQWRRCAKCGTLNHQTGGLDAVCIAGGTHDASVSRNYKVISRGVTPWKRCTKCECMVSGSGPCHAGGLHDLTASGSYTLVSHANAPGETGWRMCGLCAALVIDSGRPCPSGATHVVAPEPVFKMWSN